VRWLTNTKSATLCSRVCPVTATHMSLPAWSISVLKSTLFQQTAPFIVLFLIPASVFFFAVHLRRISFSSYYRTFTMGIEGWGFSMPWPWSSSQTGVSSSASHRKSKRKISQSGATGTRSKSKAPRTRAEQIALNVVTQNDASGMSSHPTVLSNTPLKSEMETDKSLSSESEWESARYYPGLVNISGTYCFMNSTLQACALFFITFPYLNPKISQALASLTYLQPQIVAIHAKAESLDVPTPVIDALHDLFNGMLCLSSPSLPIQTSHLTDLNTPKSSYHSLRPHGIITALSSPPPPTPSSFSNSSISHFSRTSTTLFNSREHQDAQELFQLVSECIKNEMGAVEKEGLRDRGIAGVLDFGHRGLELTSKGMNPEKGSFPNFTGFSPESKSFTHNDKQQQQMVDDARGFSLGSGSSLTTKSVFDGLTANRRSCVTCGYTEAVMHFGLDNWQLAMPRLAVSESFSMPDSIRIS